MTRNRRMLLVRTNSGNSFGRAWQWCTVGISANTFGASFATLGGASHGNILSKWESVGEESNVSGENDDDDENAGTVVTNVSSKSKKSSRSSNISKVVKRRHSIGDTSSIISRQSDMLVMTAAASQVPPLATQDFKKMPENEYNSRGLFSVSNEKDDAGVLLFLHPSSAIHCFAPRLSPASAVMRKRRIMY